MKPKVSIIVPIYNVEKYLDRCMKSLLGQTLKDIEIIMVDDESPDNCPKMCDNYAQKYDNVKVVHKKNEGLGFARNTGLEFATGEYVTFCDSDDWLELDAYETTYNKVKEKNLDVCWFQPCRVTLNNKKIFSSPVQEEYFIGKGAMSWFRKDVIGRNPEDKRSRERGMSSCMALFRREIFVDSGVRYPSERIVASEDFVFLLYFLPHVNSVGILPNVFYNYLINPQSISSNYSEAKRTRLINMLNELKDFCESNYEWKEIKNHYYSQVLRIMKVILKFTSHSKMPFLTKIKKISDETRNAFLSEFYKDPVCRKYGKADSLYIWMMKHHVGAFFVLLYKLK